jgi:hypothetical protein
MKKPILVLLAGLTLFSIGTPRAHAVVTGFGDLGLWTGTGPNQSGLVIQWNDSKSPSALAWGFNWTSAGTVNDMLLAVLSADVRLFVRGDSGTSFGPGYFGFGYNDSGNFSVTGAVDQFGAAVAPVFVGGLSDMNTNPATTQAPTTSASAAPSNPLDRYVEGWNDNGYWELFTGTGPAYPGTWTSSVVGVGGEPLTNNGWYTLSLSNPDFSPNLPGLATAAIPEPSTTLLLLLAGGVFLYARKRLHTH